MNVEGARGARALQLASFCMSVPAGDDAATLIAIHPHCCTEPQMAQLLNDRYESLLLACSGRPGGGFPMGRGGGFPGIPAGMGGRPSPYGMGYRSPYSMGRVPRGGGFGSPGLLNPQIISIFTNLFLQARALRRTACFLCISPPLSSSLFMACGAR